MAKRCEICGKGPVVGRNISHAHNVTARRFEPNLQRVRAIVNGGIQRLRVCTRCIRSNKIVKAGPAPRPSRSRSAAGGLDAAAPAAIGPYSQAIRAGSLLFVSGQIPLDPATGNLVEGDIAAQTRRVLQNVDAILQAAGASFDTSSARRCSSPT